MSAVKNLSDEAPLVSIWCLAYNHEKYIRDCLDGFVMQKTNFKFEAIIHDDASTDNTARIIQEYADKYPDIIKPIFEKENQYSKHDGSLNRIMNEHMRGKYVALCEGDDYWIDSYKLQKQVDFLENHNTYSMCFTNTEVMCSEIDLKYSNIFSHISKGEYTGAQILKSWIVHTASVLYRNYDEIPPNDCRFLYGDIITFLWLSQKGKLWCLDDTTAVYRRNAGGVTIKNRASFDQEINHLKAIEEHFGYQKTVKDKILDLSIRYFISNIFKKESILILHQVIELGYFPAFLFSIPKKLFKILRYKYLLSRKKLIVMN